MKKYWKKIALIFLLIALSVFFWTESAPLITFEALKRNSRALTSFVDSHYLFSLVVLAAAFLSTAFCVPGALVLTIGSGFLFGAAAGALYASFFLTAGSVLAFLVSRYVVGRALQRRFKREFSRFNQEIAAHGKNYLFILRVVPVMPAFVVNYLSGMTCMPVTSFATVTFAGLLPGAIVYALAGGQLANIESPKEILSGNVLTGLGLMAALALAPVVAARVRRAGPQK